MRDPARHGAAERAAARTGSAALLLLLAGCGADGSPTATPEPEPEVTPPALAAPEYRVRPPAGKLPWPHHDPSWDQGRYDGMLDSLWVINNFALYQGGDTRTSLYLHDGLDVVLPYGTPIHAVEAGTVRAILGGNEYYQSMVVEDADEPGMAWGYTHVYGFRVGRGDRVEQGTRLAHVNFQGLQHIHLDRLRLRPGGSWTVWNDLEHLQPDTFFVYRDTEPPVFEGPFRYVRNGTDSAFSAPPDGPVVVSGEVDVVVGVRDGGEWARSRVPYAGPLPFGDRHVPNRVEVEISGGGGAPLRLTAFDLSRLVIPRGSRELSAAQTLALYQFYAAVSPPAPPVGNYNRKFNFLVVTNTTGDAREGELDPGVAANAWRTAERAPDGSRRFPDGDYRVTVRAYDFKGNAAERSETVRVRN